MIVEIKKTGEITVSYHNVNFDFMHSKLSRILKLEYYLECYILGSQIRVNFVDFNCCCPWLKTAIVGKLVVLHHPTSLRTPLTKTDVDIICINKSDA